MGYETNLVYLKHDSLVDLNHISSSHKQFFAGIEHDVSCMHKLQLRVLTS